MTDEYVSPDVTVAGPGEPEVAVVGGIHGDEPSGVRAVRRLREAELNLQRGVAFVVANPAAVAAGRRFLDSDLNRVFPGDPDGDREHRIASELCELLSPLVTLSIHGTHSHPKPFALVHRSDPAEYELASRLPVPHVVDHSGVNEETVSSCVRVVEVEVGIQGTDTAAAAAERQARAFLRRVGALPGEPPKSDPDFYHMTRGVPKPVGADAELLVDNFEFVPEGTVFARVDDEKLVAERDFYPILMSETGYADIFGYEGEKLGESLRELRESWLAEA